VVGWLVGLLVGWLVGWSVGWLVCWLVGLLVGWLVEVVVLWILRSDAAVGFSYFGGKRQVCDDDDDADADAAVAVADTNGDNQLDEAELEALFQKEVSSLLSILVVLNQFM